MKVDRVIWLWSYSVSVVIILCMFQFGISTAASVKQHSGASASPAVVNTKRGNRRTTSPTGGKTNVNSSATKGVTVNKINASRTGSKMKPLSGVPVSSTPRPIASRAHIRKQSATPVDRKKTPKKYIAGQKESLSENAIGPIKVELPKPSFANEKRSTKNSRNEIVCPRQNDVKFELFPTKCDKDKDCRTRTTNQLCCEVFGVKSCVHGRPLPVQEPSHTPIFGIIPRRCPRRPLAELWWEVKVCEKDADCWPRVCCPDGQKKYCRTSKPELDSIPVPVKRSINYLSEYLECTPPPPPIFDLHPKVCNSTFDCFPNVCCQEAGKKHCRPPKKSILTFAANFLNLGLVKRLTQNLVIK